MKPIYIRMGASALIIFGIIIALLGARKTITLSVDGSSRSLQTFALTAGQALRAAGMPLAPQDSLSPKAYVWLKNGDIVQLDHASLVFIQADRHVTSLITVERTPARILEVAGLDLGAQDVLLLDGDAIDPAQPLAAAPLYRLQVMRAVSISLNGRRFASTAPSLAHALWNENVTLRSGDDLSLPALTSLTASFDSNSDLDTVLSLSRQVTITTAAGEVSFRTAAVTVGEALAEAGLSLQGLDYSQPSPDENLPLDGNIRLVRVEERVTVEQSPLPFETEYQPDPNSDLDTRSILQAGEYGLSSTRMRTRYEDGVEVSRLSEASWVSRQPLNRIVGYGTNVVMQTATASDGTTVQYWRSMQMWATSYRPQENGGTQTASGMTLQKGVCAIDRGLIPFYTQMYIPGYGNCTAGDIGGGISGRWIDLGYSDSDWQSWHQWVTVYFLWPPPENIIYRVP